MPGPVRRDLPQAQRVPVGLALGLCRAVHLGLPGCVCGRPDRELLQHGVSSDADSVLHHPDVLRP
eukprot:9938246-Heterocapsa_arctica.AAC.1